MTKAFYNKWRPANWEEVIGQEHVVQALQNAVRLDKVSHAYIFAGPRGTGKTTTARILAKSVNCESPDPAHRPDNTCHSCKEMDATRCLDLIEIDAASNTSVEDVRDLREKVNFSPSRGKYKVYIIDEVHMLSMAAFNALLKTLEEPPSHAIFILATTELHKVPETVLSRCQRYEFRRIPVSKVVAYLKLKCQAEGVVITEDALQAIARHATGSMRDAISLLDQLSSFEKEISLELVQTMLGTAANQSVIALIDAVLEGDLTKAFQVVRTALDAGIDARQYARQIVDHLRTLLQIKAGNRDQLEITQDQKDTFDRQASRCSLKSLTGMLTQFNEAISDARNSNQPGLQLEIALVHSCAPQDQHLPDRMQTEANFMPRVNQKPGPIEPREGKPTAPTAENNSPAAPPASVTPPRNEESNVINNPAEVVLRSWPEITRAIKQVGKPQTAALLNSCKPLLKNGSVVLSFRSELLKTKMESGEHLEITKNIINQVCKLDIGLACAVGNQGTDAIPANIDGTGMVGTALNHGGKIINP